MHDSSPPESRRDCASPQDRRDCASPQNRRDVALLGTRVLDLTRLAPGPFASLVLADLGAEVIKVEEPGYGDWLRYPLAAEPRPQAGEMDAGGPADGHRAAQLFELLNRSKKSITLNLKSAEGSKGFAPGRCSG
jgi:alpha-methylacyl-CoA racemase